MWGLKFRGFRVQGFRILRVQGFGCNGSMKLSREWLGLSS